MTAAVEYTTPIANALHAYKYQYISGLGKYLGELLYCFAKWPAADIVTAVPADPIRQRVRGFHHTEVIAQSFAQLSGIPYQAVLRKNRHTSTQVSTTSKQARNQNLANVFSSAIPPPTPNTSILVIDDVFTTGATLNECASVLKAAGYNQVLGLTVASKM